MVPAGPETLPLAVPPFTDVIVGAGRLWFAPVVSEMPWPALSWIEFATMRSLIEKPSIVTPSPELWEIVLPGPIWLFEALETWIPFPFAPVPASEPSGPTKFPATIVPVASAPI